MKLGEDINRQFFPQRHSTKVRVSAADRPKKVAHPARVAKVGQENIETVHDPKATQATNILCKDKVAVL